MAATFFVVPQWQGSGSSRAMRLIDGAEAIRGDLPAASTVLVEVPAGAGSDEGTRVQRLSSVIAVRDALDQALGAHLGLPIVIGGDCGVDLAPVSRASAAGPVALLWLDAHPDLHSPQSSPSSAFHGMVVRTLLGDGPAALLPAAPLHPDRVLLAGTRALDEAEQDYVDAQGIRLIAPSELDPAAITEAVAATGADAVYIHVDLDVLDPAEIDGIGFPEPFGLTLAQLLEVIAAAKLALPLAGAAVTEFAPSSPEAAPDDLGTILRIIGALTA
ncbi:arginase family protein [soil metagenome]